jgi:hypothetical protein
MTARTNPFAPVRRHLPFSEWPGEDRAMWEALVQPGATLLDDSGPFANLAPPTRAAKRWHYGTWLSFIRLRHRALLTEPPTARVTPATVGEWFTQLGQLVAPCTCLMRAADLLTVMSKPACGRAASMPRLRSKVPGKNGWRSVGRIWVLIPLQGRAGVKRKGSGSSAATTSWIY